MTALVEKIASQGGATRQRSAKRPPSPKPAGRRITSSPIARRRRQFNLKLSFAKSKVQKDEIIGALEAIIQRTPEAK